MHTELVISEVLTVCAHPRADCIWIARVAAGGQAAQVVFGGTRMLEPGDCVIWAPPGSTPPGGRKMRRRRYRGVVSEGMLCSAAEAGRGSDTAEVMVLGKVVR